MAGTSAAIVLVAAVFGNLSGKSTLKIDHENLSGTWTKISTEECSRYYPAQIKITANGLYQAPGGPESGSIWHGGDWSLGDDNSLSIQAANDGMLTYLAEIDGEHLVITDQANCVVRFRKG